MVQPLSQTPGFTAISPSIIQQDEPQTDPAVSLDTSSQNQPLGGSVELPAAQDLSQATAVSAPVSGDAPASASATTPTQQTVDFAGQLGTILSGILGDKEEEKTPEEVQQAVEAPKPIADTSAPEAKAEAEEPAVPELKGYKSVIATASKPGPVVHTDIKATSAYIVEAAKKRNIDPAIALKVAQKEGLQRGTWQSNVNKNGKREPSYGPFQLLVGGGSSGFPEGMGNDFQKKTGKSPSDPSTLTAGIDFALDHVKKYGWSAWYGAKAAGISKWQGVG